MSDMYPSRGEETIIQLLQQILKSVSPRPSSPTAPVTEPGEKKSGVGETAKLRSYNGFGSSLDYIAGIGPLRALAQCISDSFAIWPEIAKIHDVFREAGEHFRNLEARCTALEAALAKLAPAVVESAKESTP